MELDVYSTLVAACLTLLLGRFLTSKVPLLNRFTIPSPVAGGLLVAFVLLILKNTFDYNVKFDTVLQTPLMLAFFATIGLNANFASLKAGGKALFIFLFVVVGLLILQNTLGIVLAKLLGIDPLMGLLAGSITLSGGHGTGGSWAKEFIANYGFDNAMEVAMACATFGLVLGGLIGGPVARFLLRRETPVDANSALEDANVDGLDAFEKPKVKRSINSNNILETITMIVIALTFGKMLMLQLQDTKFALPEFVCVLFVGVIINNVLSFFKPHIVSERAVSILGNVSLSLFLAMALMSLQLWQLADLAIPMLVILGVQTVMMAAYAIFITYPVMKRVSSKHDAAVLSAGHCGFGMGATPTAIANMQVITDRFGPSRTAFLVVPMVGAFFIDIVNALAIKGFLSLPMFTSLLKSATAVVGG